MTFLTGSLLFGLLAAAVPVIIHLMHRQRTVPVRWGAMQFLLESPLQFRRRKKVDHWLLLLARMAMLGLLAFLLARPLARATALNLLGSGGGADIAVVVDHSLSAGRRAAAEAAATPSQASVFDRGVATVDAVASAMRPNDTLSVVLAEHRPDTSLTGLPVRSAGAADVRRRLRQLKPGMTAAAVPDAIQAARELLARGPNAQKVILVVTDEQRNAWRIDDASAWSAALGDRAVTGAAKVYGVPAPAVPNARDIVVGDLSVEPGVVGVRRPAQITATLSNTGPGDATAVTATLRVNGSEAGKQSFADLKAGTSRTVRFDHAFADADSNWLEVRANVEDALAADNAALAAVNVRQRLPVLVIDGQLAGAGNFRSSQFLLAAMQPAAEEAQTAASLIQPKVISASAADAEKLDDYAAVVVNDVPQLGSAAADHLASYARSGHGVWLVLGPRMDGPLLGKQLAQTGLLTADIAEARPTGPTPPGVELKAPQNPTVALVAAAERNAMTGAVTRQWWRVTPHDGDEQVVLASAQGGDPLVLERPVGRNGGRVVVWCTSADGAWNNWPLMPNFVPLVNETVFHLSSAGSEPAQRRITAGAPIEWSAPADPRVTSAAITRPDGKVVPRQPSLSAGRQRLTYNDTAEPGLYTLRFEPTSIPQPAYFAVNIDRRELDPATLTEADYAWLQRRKFIDARIRPQDLATAVGGTSPGAELWRWLAPGVLALLVFETVMTRRMVRLQAPAQTSA
jgi:hypothetical protein